MGIKKKILLVWLAIETVGICISLTAVKQIVARVVFSDAPRAAHVITPIAPGLTEIMVPPMSSSLYFPKAPSAKSSTRQG